MKVQNAVVGMEVQVKRNCRGHSDEFIKKGLVCTVSRIDDSYGEATYQLRLLNPDIDDGYAWVNASDVRRYIKPTESPEPDVEPDEPQEDIQVGDSVLVGAEGAGCIIVDEEYAGLVCTIHRNPMDGESVFIKHPDVREGRPYRAYKKYLTKVTPRIDLSSLRVGDYIVANDTDPHLQEGVAYRVVQEGATFPMVALHHSEKESWREGYCVIDRNVAKILREVNDATPRS